MGSRELIVHASIGTALAASFLVAIGYLRFLSRQNLKMRIDVAAMKLEIKELRELVAKNGRARQVTFKEAEEMEKKKAAPVRAAPAPAPVSVAKGDAEGQRQAMPRTLPLFPRATSASSITSNEDDYQDAVDVEEWLNTIPPSSSTIIPFSSPSSFAEVDARFGTPEVDKSYTELKKNYSASPEEQKNVELLWRLAKCCHEMAGVLDKKDAKKKDLVMEGRKYASEAAALDETHFLALKWAAALSGASTDFLGTKEKIEQGNVFKAYLDKALAIDAKEYSLLHMRGRFAYSVANLSWLERKAAATFFAAPPTATIDEALTDFLAADAVKHEWIENVLFIARCYLAKGDKESTVKYARQALELPAGDDHEKELHAEAQALVSKYAK